jgi:hypothetical protein
VKETWRKMAGKPSPPCEGNPGEKWRESLHHHVSYPEKFRKKML